MVLNPDVVILDEPFAGLDRKAQAFLMDFLTEMKTNGKTLIIATHDEKLTETLADQVLNMSES
jgi:energy-coupling factor transporter ATP-binding protein EcfA2